VGRARGSCLPGMMAPALSMTNQSFSAEIVILSGPLKMNRLGCGLLNFSFSFFSWVTGELSTLRQLMKVPNEPGLSPNNGLENVSLSDQSMASNPCKGQAKCPGAKTTSHDGMAGHVMTHMCHPSKARRMASVTIQVPMQGICAPATGIALWPAKLPSPAMSS